jgi:hypothetical protein
VGVLATLVGLVVVLQVRSTSRWTVAALRDAWPTTPAGPAGRTQGLGPYVEQLRVHPDQKLQVTTPHLRQDNSRGGYQDLSVVTAGPAGPPVHRSQP